MTIEQRIIGTALRAQGLSHEDRIEALARVGERLRNFDSDPIERLVSRLMQDATNVTVPTTEVQEIGLAIAAHATELGAKFASDADLRRGIAASVLAGEPRDLSEVLPETVVPMVRSILADVLAEPDPEKKKLAASALSESIVATDVKAMPDRDEVIMGVVSDMSRAGLNPMTILSAEAMQVLKRCLIAPSMRDLGMAG